MLIEIYIYVRALAKIKKYRDEEREKGQHIKRYP